MSKYFDKYYVEKNHQTGDVLEKDGEPVLSSKPVKKGCPLEQRQADILNRSWKKTGVFYKEVKVKVVDEKTPERIALEEEATELGIRFNPKIRDEKLKLKINEAKDK